MHEATNTILKPTHMVFQQEDMPYWVFTGQFLSLGVEGVCGSLL